MYPEIAYSVEMQVVLAIVAFIVNFIIVYRIAGLILLVYGENSDAKQKSIFAFIIGAVLNTAWSYAVYFAYGMYMSPITYILVVNPNPVFALFYYIMGVKTLRLSPIRSIRLMSHVYLYYMLIKSLASLLASAFFVQSAGRQNFLLNVFKNLTIFAVFLIVINITSLVLRRQKKAITLRDNLFINLKKELALYFIKAAVIYFVLVGVPLFFAEKVLINLVVFFILLLMFSLSILWDMYICEKNDVLKKDVHINSLLKDTLPPLSNEIYELRERINENPALISVILDMLDYAEKINVKMNTTLLSRLDNFYIDNTDVCVLVSCLLDNAIEAAGKSRLRRASIAIETTLDGGKLIIINNRVDEAVDTSKLVAQCKRGRGGKGLAAVRQINSKYGNCTFRLSCYNYEVSAYFEIKPANGMF